MTTNVKKVDPRVPVTYWEMGKLIDNASSYKRANVIGMILLVGVGFYLWNTGQLIVSLCALAAACLLLFNWQGWQRQHHHLTTGDKIKPSGARD